MPNPGAEPPLLLQLSSDRPDGPVLSEHPQVIGTCTFERVADYEYAAPGGARWLTTHDLAQWDIDAGEVPEATAVVYEQIVPARGWLTSEGPVDHGELPAGVVVLSVTMDVEEDALDAFNGWYDEEHLPTLLAVPGIDAVRRFRAVGGDLPEAGRHRFLALYEFESSDLLATEAWASAAAITPRNEQVMAHARRASQLYRQVDLGHVARA